MCLNVLINMRIVKYFIQLVLDTCYSDIKLCAYYIQITLIYFVAVQYEEHAKNIVGLYYVNISPFIH